MRQGTSVLGILLILMVENFVVDERVFILKSLKAKMTGLTDRGLVLVSVVSGEA